MNRDVIQLAQKYLTINTDVRDCKIVDIVALACTHTPDELIAFLYQLYSERRERLHRLVVMSNTNQELDRAISGLFRIHMALKTITNALEDEPYADKRRTAASH